jgi:hypothetical protein
MNKMLCFRSEYYNEVCSSRGSDNNCQGLPKITSRSKGVGVGGQGTFDDGTELICVTMVREVPKIA